MNALIQKLLDNRGYTRDYLLSINNPIHNDLLDIDTMCDKLHEIHMRRQNITVLPDFDTDGIMSGVIGFAGLAELGFSVSLFIPNPDDGYGFTADTIDRLVKEYPDTNAVITCDVGITCFDGISRAKALGLQMLITDHHMQQQVAKDADVIVNPMRIDETYTHPSICGAYVLYQILEHYASKYANAFEQEQIRRLKVFAGIGTVSDIMPLLYENRELVRDSVSISRLVYANGDDVITKFIMGNDIYRRAFYGLHCFYKTMAEYGKLKHARDITEEFYAYYMAPAFNSVKRMNEDMTIAFDVFFGSNPQESAAQLYNLNVQRKHIVSNYMSALQGSSQPYAPFVYITDAPKGILGLMANEIMNETGMPVLVLNHDGNKFTGSGRSPEWYQFLDRVLSEGFYAAGHNAAFGVGFTDTAELKSFLAFLDKDVNEVRGKCVFTAPEPDFVISQDGTGDTVIDIELFRSYLSELEYYRPFGKSFPAPDIRLKFKADESEWFVIGSTNQHLKIILPYGFEVLCWNQANRFGEQDKKTEFEVAGRISQNEYNDKITIQFTGTLL